jgi:hypothetical protein
VHQRGEEVGAHEGGEPEDKLRQHREEREVHLAAGGPHQGVDDHLQHRHAEADDEESDDHHRIGGPQGDRQAPRQVQRKRQQQRRARAARFYQRTGRDRDQSVGEEE